MQWIISSVQICCTSIFLRSASRAFSAFSNRSSTLRWSSLSRAMASGFSRLGMARPRCWMLRVRVAIGNHADNEAFAPPFPILPRPCYDCREGQMADIQDRFPQTAVTARAGSPAVSAALATTAVLVAIYLAIGAALLPFAQDAGPELPGFNALFAGGVFVTEGVTCFLLMVLYRRQPRRSVLPLVGAYLFSALITLGYLLVYPGAVAPGRPLAGTPQSIAWIYNSWIVGFASLTFAAVLVEVLYGGRRAPDRKARLLAVLVPTLATLAALL